jgi:hypothetical protein
MVAQLQGSCVRQVQVSANSITVTHSGAGHTYRGIDVSHSYGVGARGDSNKVWILVSKAPDGMYSFIAEVPEGRRRGAMVLEEGADGEGKELKSLWGKKLQKCPA